MAMKTNFYFFSRCYIFSTILITVKSYLDFEELKSIHYGIDIVNKPVLLGKELPTGSVHLTSKYGQHYQCLIPDQVEQERQKEEKERVAMEIGIVELLKPMESSSCLLKTRDWWSYEFCYRKYVRQFHLEEGQIKGDVIYIGQYESDFDWNNETLRDKKLESNHALNKYHSQRYTNGSKCDLTGGLRSVEVRFMCEVTTSDYISRIDEPETCAYVITIHTNKLCNHPYLKPAEPKTPVPITCNPLLDEQQYNNYLIDLAADEKEREEVETKARLAAVEAEERDRNKGESIEEHGTVVSMDSQSSDINKLKVEKTLQNAFGKQMNKIADDSGTEVSDVKMTFKVIDNMADLESVLREQLTQAQKQRSEFKNLATSKKKTEKEKEKENLDTHLENEDKDKTKDDEDVISEFEKEITDVKNSLHAQRERFSTMKNKIGDSVRSEFENFVEEAEEEAGLEVDKQQAFQQLSKTLNNLLNRLEKTEEEITNVDKELEHFNDKNRESQNIEKSTDTTQEVKEDITVDSRLNEKLLREIGSVKREQMNKIEEKVKQGLEKAGINTGDEESTSPANIKNKGGKIQVKIITAGYYDANDDSLHLLSENDNSIQGVIISLMNGSDDAVKEETKHKTLEENYSKVWGKTKKQSKTPNI